MISHEYKCIFIHIPACAGTSIEEWIVGEDWWNIEPATKHILASQAKRLYKNYWSEYFKFSIVREPVNRFKSCLRFPSYSFLTYDEGEIDFTKYLKVFSRFNKVLEYDWRFYERQEVEHDRHVRGSLYDNVLDEQLDFIGKFEELPDVIDTIKRHTGIKSLFSSHLQSSRPEVSQLEINQTSRHFIERLFWRDYKKYNYYSSIKASNQNKKDFEELQIPDFFSQISLIKDDHIKLQSRIRDLELLKRQCRNSIYEIAEKDRLLLSLQKTVEDLVVERDHLSAELVRLAALFKKYI